MLRMFPVNLCSLCGIARVSLKSSQRHLSHYILEMRFSQHLKLEDCFGPQQMILLRSFHQTNVLCRSNKYSVGRPRVTSFSLAETADDKRKQRGGLGSMVKVHNHERGKSIKLKHFEKVSQFESSNIENNQQNTKPTKSPSKNECAFMVDFLPSNITVESLQHYFQEFGALSNIYLTLNVNIHNTHATHSFAFIVFDGDQSPIPNIQGKHEIDGSPRCFVNASRKSVTAMRRSRKPMQCLLENLPPSTNEERIEEWFSAYGRVKSVRIIRGNQNSSQWAVIEFVTAAEAAKVSDIGTFQVHDRTLTLRRLGAVVRSKLDRDDSENQEEGDVTD